MPAWNVSVTAGYMQVYLYYREAGQAEGIRSRFVQQINASFLCCPAVFHSGVIVGVRCATGKVHRQVLHLPWIGIR